MAPDDENVYYSGECATAEEIEDATILAISTEAEEQAFEVEVAEALDYYCNVFLENPSDDELCVQANAMRQAVAGAQTNSGNAQLLSDSPEPESSVWSTFQSNPTLDAADRSCDAAARTCLGQWLVYTGNVGHFGWRMWKWWSALNALDPPGAAIGDAAIAAGLAAVLVTGTGVILFDCFSS
jgi:hypothetical protein